MQEYLIQLIKIPPPSLWLSMILSNHFKYLPSLLILYLGSQAIRSYRSSTRIQCDKLIKWLHRSHRKSSVPRSSSHGYKNILFIITLIGFLIDVGTRDETSETSGACLALKNTYLKTLKHTNETINYGMIQMSGGDMTMDYD